MLFVTLLAFAIPLSSRPLLPSRRVLLVVRVCTIIAIIFTTVYILFYSRFFADPPSRDHDPASSPVAHHDTPSHTRTSLVVLRLTNTARVYRGICSIRTYERSQDLCSLSPVDYGRYTPRGLHRCCVLLTVVNIPSWSPMDAQASQITDILHGFGSAGVLRCGSLCTAGASRRLRAVPQVNHHGLRGLRLVHAGLEASRGQHVSEKNTIYQTDAVQTNKPQAPGWTARYPGWTVRVAAHRRPPWRTIIGTLCAGGEYRCAAQREVFL